MNDRDALLLAIAANPGEDTPRLAFADWCEENGEPAWAEYVRAGVELGATGMTTYGRLRRSRDLLRDHEAAWRKAGKCPGCGGHGWVTSRTRTAEMDRDEYGKSSSRCPHCSGTGDRGGLCEIREGEIVDRTYSCDLCMACTVTDRTGYLRCVHCGSDRLRKVRGDPQFVHPVEWSRGFPEAVHCDVGDVFWRTDVERGVPQWSPTPWALSVCRWWPVERFVLTNLRPTQLLGSLWSWHAQTFELARADRWPHQLWRDEVTPYYDTEQEAIDALARRAAAVVRQELKQRPNTQNNKRD